jgi:hypothetical protein
MPRKTGSTKTLLNDLEKEAKNLNSAPRKTRATPKWRQKVDAVWDVIKMVTGDTWSGIKNLMSDVGMTPKSVVGALL